MCLVLRFYYLCSSVYFEPLGLPLGGLSWIEIYTTSVVHIIYARSLPRGQVELHVEAAHREAVPRVLDLVQ